MSGKLEGAQSMGWYEQLDLARRGQGTRHASFHLQRDSLQRYKSLDRKSLQFRHPSFRLPGHRSSFDDGAAQGRNNKKAWMGFMVGELEGLGACRPLCEAAGIVQSRRSVHVQAGMHVKWTR